MLNGSASLAMSTSVLKALPGKLDIKRHSPSILYLYHICLKFSQQTRKIDKRTDILNKRVIKAMGCSP